LYMIPRSNTWWEEEHYGREDERKKSGEGTEKEGR
jgi:hypothetical protein